MESNAIEERVELSMLYDFYGALLKENQQRMFEACILDDYGYTEIAEEEGFKTGRIRCDQACFEAITGI